MGKEVVIETAEEMCDLMCENKVPLKKTAMPREEPEQWWVFTFGVGQPNGGHYVKFFGTYGSAREKMVNHFGRRWAFQYSLAEWERLVNDPKRNWNPETEIALEDCVCEEK